MRAMAAGDGSSLKSTSSPPLTWTSMKPGASQQPLGTLCTGTSALSCWRGPSQMTREPSITTAQSDEQRCRRRRYQPLLRAADGSCRTRDLVKIARPVDIDTKSVSQVDDHRVEALNEAKRIGLRLVCGESRQGTRRGGCRVRDQQCCPLPSQITAKLAHA